MTPMTYLQLVGIVITAHLVVGSGCSESEGSASRMNAARANLRAAGEIVVGYAMDHENCPSDPIAVKELLAQVLSKPAYDRASVKHLIRGNDEWGRPLLIEVHDRRIAIISTVGADAPEERVFGVVVDCEAQHVVEVNSMEEVATLLKGKRGNNIGGIP